MLWLDNAGFWKRFHTESAPHTHNHYCLKPIISLLRLPLWTQGMAFHIKWSKDKNMNISLLKHKASGPEKQLRTPFCFETGKK